MKLTTEVNLPKSKLQLSHRQKMMLMGSCFAQEIGQKLAGDGFDCLVNPFGVLYNPMSIQQALELLMTDRMVTGRTLVQQDGLWHSWLFHGSFSAPTKQEALDRMNASLRRARTFLKDLDVLVLTWGTNKCYYLRATDDRADGVTSADEGVPSMLVANCHKVPQKQFKTVDVSHPAIDALMQSVLDKLMHLNPKLQVVLTVSPIRYVSYGLHESQLSKANLLLAADALCRRNPGRVHYFPAYEIVLDELRDYRFFADDLAHPSPLAVDYVYERFTQALVPAAEQAVSREIRQVARDMSHRPLHPESAEYQRFKEQLKEKIKQLKQKYPYLRLEK